MQKTEHDRVSQTVLPENADTRKTGIIIEIMKHLSVVARQVIPKNFEPTQITDTKAKD